eukprot:COSAG02_NODE_4548_length_5227_cov_29.808112_2_plen_387_part_00
MRPPSPTLSQRLGGQFVVIRHTMQAAAPTASAHRQAGRQVGRQAGRRANTQAGRRGRHEGGVEPLALSCSTDLKSAPRTDEDHHGLRARRAQVRKAVAATRGVEMGTGVPRRQPGPSIENKQYAGPELRPIAKQRRSASFETPAGPQSGARRARLSLYHAGLTRNAVGFWSLARLFSKGPESPNCAAAGIGIDWMLRVRLGVGSEGRQKRQAHRLTASERGASDHPQQHRPYPPRTASAPVLKSRQAGRQAAGSRQQAAGRQAGPPRRRSRTPSTLVLHRFEVCAPYRRGSSWPYSTLTRSPPKLAPRYPRTVTSIRRFWGAKTAPLAHLALLGGGALSVHFTVNYVATANALNPQMDQIHAVWTITPNTCENSWHSTVEMSFAAD